MSDTPDSGLASAYEQLLSLLTDSPGLDAFLDQVVRLAADVVTPAAASGITAYRDGQPITVACSGDLAAQVDEIQYGADEGPCLDSLRTGQIIDIPDLTRENRWDDYRPHAVAHGVISSLSLPLAVDGRTVAALNLYSSQRSPFDPAAKRHAEAFAAQCAAALTVILRQANQAQLQQQLTEAMAARSVIDQAIGILVGQQRCTADVAFDLLRQASQHRNRKLRDVAADIITNVTGQPPQSPTEFRTTTGDHDAR